MREVPDHSVINESGQSDGDALVYFEQRPSFFWKIFRVLAVSMCIVSVVTGIMAYLWLDELGVFDADESRLQYIAERQPVDNSVVYDRNGTKIGEFFNSYHVYVPFDEMPDNIVNAIIAIEDRNFWKHGGIDFKAMLRVLVVHLKGGYFKQGASTITQQVVRHFLLPKSKTINRKTKEIALAMKLESIMSKKKIFEIYANSMFLGGGSHGVGAAAYRYFGKPLSKLQDHEAALIAGLFQSPSRYNPSRFPERARKRQRQVIKAMYYARMIDMKRARSMLMKKPEYKEYKPINSRYAPFFVDYVQEQALKLLAGKDSNVKNRGLRIHTTIDVELQKIADDTLKDSSDILDKVRKNAAFVRNKKGKKIRPNAEAAILSVDPNTGEILVMSGGLNYKKSQFNRTISAYRSPGSAFKPIVYSLALNGRWKWSDLIYVSPIDVGSYRPRTPTSDYLTEVTLLRAFYRSMNTPTIELGSQLGIKKILKHARLLGIETKLKEEFGTMIGSSDVTMKDLARVYSVFASGGMLTDTIAITRIENREGKVLYKAPSPKKRQKRVIKNQVAYLMSMGMKAVLSWGTGWSARQMARYAAGKTGTSNGSVDNWFCGYTPNLVSIVWVGTDEHANIFGNASGGHTALPIWQRFMKSSFSTRKPTKFRRPQGVLSAKVHSKYGHRTNDGIKMFFIRGNEPDSEPSALEALKNAGGQSYRNVFTGH